MTDQAKPAPRPRVPRLFPKGTLGWASIGMSIAMLVVFTITLFQVVPLLTQPPVLAKDYLEKATGMDAPFIIALEYESFAIRTQGIQIALGFLVGMLLGAFGLLLFAIGATDAFEAHAESDTANWSLKSTAPGLVVMIMGGIIVAFAVGKGIPHDFQAIYDQGKNAIKTEQHSKPAEAKVSTERVHE